MRKALRQILIDNIPQINGVYEPNIPSAKTQKPYLIIREGVQDPEAPWAAFSTIVEVWPYVSRTTFQEVDALADAIIGVLRGRRFAADDEQYLVNYLGSSGQDFVDEEWDANTRGLRFHVFALGWLSGLTYDPDPVEVLNSWTRATWPEVHSDPRTWTPDDETPGIYWRLERLSPTLTTATVNWMEAQIAGHILVSTMVVRLEWLRKVTEELAMQRRLRMSGGGPLELVRLSTDSAADPMRTGQIQLTVRFGVLQPRPQAEVLNTAVVSGAVNEEVT